MNMSPLKSQSREPALKPAVLAIVGYSGSGMRLRVASLLAGLEPVAVKP